jgi:exodeoxyribonuclease VII large subunit
MSKTIIENQTVLSVSDLTFEIKKKLETTFNQVKVKGEISSLKHQSSGHIYFTLKDANAQISAVLFAGNAKNLKRLPRDGDQVILEGELSVYPPRGGYQIIVRSLSYDGVGDLLMKLHQLKLELKDLGYFETSRKKPLPVVPKTIGVITSPTGAVIQDIINVLKRRLHAFHLILNPVKVQGEGAKEEIAKAIEEFNKYQLADVLIVGRGGGSIEDLWAFNERIVADAIFRSKIPIISAVGHETDFSIADFVADVRAPTPSAAAEIVCKESSKIHEDVERAKKRLRDNLKHALEISYQKVDDAEDKLKSIWKNLTFRQKSLLKTKKAHLESLLPSKQILMQKNRLQLVKKQLNRIHEIISKKTDALKYISEHLYAIHPKTTLKKGYCICFRENKDCAIIKAKDVPLNQNLSILFYDGEVITQTKEVILTNE